MVCHWRRDGVVVLVTLARGDDGGLWETTRVRMCGVASLDSEDELTRTRVLSLPEAYYALTVDRLLPLRTAMHSSLQAVWEDFAAASSSFVSHYIVYHHFRRLGWLLRSGLNYGAQFVLYRGDPDTFHSEYIVYVSSGDATSQWHALQARTRVAEDVKKTVLLCEVSVGDSSGEDTPVMRGRDGNGGRDPVMETTGRYEIHGIVYALDAVLIRSWDPATVDDDRVSYTFTPQPMLLKKPKRAPKKPKEKKRPRAVFSDDPQ
jgi:tRNA-intron lyase